MPQTMNALLMLLDGRMQISLSFIIDSLFHQDDHLASNIGPFAFPWSSISGSLFIPPFEQGDNLYTCQSCFGSSCPAGMFLLK